MKFKPFFPMTNDFHAILSAWNFLFGYVTILLLHVSLLKKSKLSIYTNQKVLTVFDNQL